LRERNCPNAQDYFQGKLDDQNARSIETAEPDHSGESSGRRVRAFAMGMSCAERRHPLKRIALARKQFLRGGKKLLFL
jgi:hypothetical protein